MTTTAVDRTLAADREIVLITRFGVVLRVRPVTEADAPQLAAFFDSVDPEDLRFRFLSARQHVSPDQLIEMIEVNHRRKEHLLAFDAESGVLVASAVLVADEPMEVAEVAIAVARANRGQGIGWTLLKHLAELARSRGIKRLRSIESRQNHAALEVERALGFSACAYEHDPALVLVEALLQ